MGCTRARSLRLITTADKERTATQMISHSRFGRRTMPMLFVASALAFSAATLPTAVARDVPYVPTPPGAVQKMLEMVAAKPGDVLYDLGSGDGRIVIAAVTDFGVERAIGIDIDPRRTEEAIANAEAAGVADRAEFKTADLFETDFRDADVVTMYLLTRVNLRLRPRLLQELKPGTRLVSHQFKMDDWKPDAEAVAEGRLLYHWVVPAQVEGRWRDRSESEGVELSMTQKFQEVAGTVTAFGRERKIENGRLNGDKLSFEARGDGQGDSAAVRFEGRVTEEGTIEGRLAMNDKTVPVRASRDR